MRRKSQNNDTTGGQRGVLHRIKSYRLIRNLLIGFIVASVINLLFSSLFYTPKMFRLADERRELEMRYEVLQNRIRSSQRKIDEIRHRDNLVYRPLFSSDTLSIEGIYTPYAEQKYAHLQGNDFLRYAEARSHCQRQRFKL